MQSQALPIRATHLELSETKHCGKCEQSKTLPFFPRDRSRPDGRWHTCKLCNQQHGQVLRRAASERRIVAQPSAVIIELKQWTDAQPSWIEACVVVFINQALRDKPHPSQQALQYKQYLEDSSTVFSEGKVHLAACSYLSNHQHTTDSALLASKFSGLLAQVPMFLVIRRTSSANFCVSV